MSVLTLKDIRKQAKENAEKSVKEIENNVILSEYELETSTPALNTDTLTTQK